jgi:hypothetical protein
LLFSHGVSLSVSVQRQSHSPSGSSVLGR